MTSKRPTSFTVGRGTVLPWEGTALVEVAAFFVPTLLHRLEVYKERFPYETDADYQVGLDLVTAQQEAYLMDATDRIVSEVRALRMGTLTSEEYRDPQLNPYTVPLTSLATLTNIVLDFDEQVSASTAQTNALLTEIRDQLAAGASGEDVLERLDILITLLGTVA